MWRKLPTPSRMGFALGVTQMGSLHTINHRAKQRRILPQAAAFV
jgi:hypothetical protein